MSTGGLSAARLDRMHGIMAGHVERATCPASSHWSAGGEKSLSVRSA
jgi:hypothetical protein